MLWQKESPASKDAFYVNLFVAAKAKNPKIFQDVLDMDKLLDTCGTYKCNESAQNYREEGNSYYRSQQWNNAIDKYNRSLAFVKNNSKLFSLAYANRSSCFFQLKMYDKCLIDIELAKNEAYPHKLMPKLNKRKADCLRLIAENISSEKNKLSYEPHTDYPGLANILEMRSNAKFGRHIVTTENVEVGKTVLLDECYFADTFISRYETCAMCLKRHMNLVPCSKCQSALICHNGCKNSEIHRLECDIRSNPSSAREQIANIRMPIVRSILIAMQTFANVNDLMDFVEDAIKSDQFEIPSFTDDKSVYRAFLKLGTIPNTIEPQHIYRIHHLLLKQKRVAAFFSGEQSHRFLMHLIYHHMKIVMQNAIVWHYSILFPNIITYCFGILNSYFNHSCAPNVVFYTENGSVIGKVIRPIEKGEQLFTTYAPYVMWSLEKIQKHLLTHFDFQCQCERCTPSPEHKVDLKELHDDPDYKFLNNSITKRIYDDERMQTIVKEKCINLFTKFGHAKWFEHLKVIADLYIENERSPTLAAKIYGSRKIGSDPLESLL